MPDGKFVPCKPAHEYDVCAYCQSVLRAHAHVIEGESEEDRPHPGPDDHFEQVEGAGLFCGGKKCDHPPSVTRCDSCGSTRMVVFAAKCSDLFTALDLAEGKAYGYFNDEPSCYVPEGVLGAGDHVRGTICLECGKLQGRFPTSLTDD